MDDGTKLQLKVTIDPTTGFSTWDYTGSSPESYCNCERPLDTVECYLMLLLL